MDNMHLVTGYLGMEHIKATDQGAFNAALLGAGQFVLARGKVFEAQIISNNQIRVHDGELMMQGRFVRIDPDSYVDLTIQNGEQGKLRNDLIVARYTKDSGTGVEGVNLVVIKGESVDSVPADPAYTEGDIAKGNALLNEFPLWRIPLEGLNVGEPVALFGEPFVSFEKLSEDVSAELDEKVEVALAAMDEKIENFDGGLQMELLWENASPTSAFAAQTIALDLSEYTMLLIVNRWSTVYDGYGSGIVLVDGKEYFLSIWDHNIVGRALIANKTGITFKDGRKSDASGNYDPCIPCKIYGVKGVNENV